MGLRNSKIEISPPPPIFNPEAGATDENGEVNPIVLEVPDSYNVIVTLSEESLLMVEYDIICPILSCRQVLSRKETLMNHTKFHTKDIANLEGEITLMYRCPIDSCRTIPFKHLQALKQHYKKVHLPKNFKCPICSRSFGLERFLTYHQQHCGRDFTCPCGKSYKTLSGLREHAKKKEHDVSEYKSQMKIRRSKPVSYKTATVISSDVENAEPMKMSSSDTDETPVTPHVDETLIPRASLSVPKSIGALGSIQQILPKPSTIVYILPPPIFILQTQPVALAKVDFGVQTNSSNPSKLYTTLSSQQSQTEQMVTATPTKSDAASGRTNKKKSTETQTARVRVRISAETQTSVVTKRPRCNRKKLNIQTQTQAAQVKESQPSTSDMTYKATSPTKISPTTSTSSCSPSWSENGRPLQNQFDLFNEMDEVHSQTQTESDILLGENFQFDYLEFDEDEISEILELVENKTAETQTKMQPRLSLEQTVPSSVNAVSTNAEYLFAEDATKPLFDEFLGQDQGGTGYLETMDSETQTQSANFVTWSWSSPNL